jgi:hypothetical protein
MSPGTILLIVLIVLILFLMGRIWRPRRARGETEGVRSGWAHTAKKSP